MKIPIDTVAGDRELCTWQPVAGITWVQTRDPKYASRLVRRQDGRLVARGVAGGYLRTFEFKKPLRWAIRLMARYAAAETGANEPLIRAAGRRVNLLKEAA